MGGLAIRHDLLPAVERLNAEPDIVSKYQSNGICEAARLALRFLRWGTDATNRAFQSLAYRWASALAEWRSAILEGATGRAYQRMMALGFLMSTAERSAFDL